MAAVFPLGLDGYHIGRGQFPFVCQVRTLRPPRSTFWALQALPFLLLLSLPCPCSFSRHGPSGFCLAPSLLSVPPDFFILSLACHFQGCHGTPCRGEAGGTERHGRGPAQSTLGQWWPVCGMGAESKNWHLPVGALAAVWKDGGGDLKQQKGEQGLGVGTTDTGRRPCGTLDTCKFLGLRRRAGFSSEICVVLCYGGGRHMSFPCSPLLLCSGPCPPWWCICACGICTHRHFLRGSLSRRDPCWGRGKRLAAVMSERSRSRGLLWEQRESRSQSSWADLARGGIWRLNGAGGFVSWRHNGWLFQGQGNVLWVEKTQKRVGQG